jgi:hypothetical protein
MGEFVLKTILVGPAPKDFPVGDQSQDERCVAYESFGIGKADH